ncbi:hypothetical protein C900_03185 [Fulvivirga imtechensis AK7]|uniref:Uncharacterized protein n=1 Tax=Fulvivirga imtechensis AK7 TaxID=1237149 RepID=L8JQC3_9BACT|nr:hypothetical protein C900_03185 [Fulvivirga imtechensis AK7]
MKTNLVLPFYNESYVYANKNRSAKCKHFCHILTDPVNELKISLD